MIQERIAALRSLMAERQIDAYMIPTSDFHESEYVGDYFKCRKFITGFTGSAEEEYLAEVMPQNGTLGFDGRVVNSQLGEKLEELLEDKHVKFSWKEDLEDLIWEDRPALSAEPVWILKENYAGKSAADKIADLREAMKKEKTTVHVLTTLDDIVWLLNIRGNDVVCNPVVLSYALVTMERFYLFINEAVLDSEVKSYLKELGVTVRPYNDIYDAVSQLKGQKVLLETAKTNYAIISNLDESNAVVDRMNPTAPAKAVKNPVEIENMKKAHIKDGVAMAKFICWLKKNIGKQTITELDAEHYLDNLRAEQEGNLGLSFHTISAYGANAAMCHYSATPESNAALEPKGLYLVDSGGQYYEGTTDVTRTISLGETTEAEREHFTLSVISMLRLAAVKFLYGCRGLTLDYVAREPLWSRGLNFDHGTGHGVGYLLNVHERPNGIRWRMVPERQDNCVLEEGMVTSDEPGIYIEGSHGVRTENLIVCKKAEKNEYGQFMEFEFLTFVPIDLEALDKSLMNERDVELLNSYHSAVYEKISPYLTAEEAEWLKENTRAI